jgi:choline/glycine/proline betaine transport protein
VQARVLGTLSWFYILSVTIFVIIAFVLGLGRFGSLEPGPDDSRADYPFATWLAMLFAAGMGIGPIYYAVGEPMSHFIAPSTAEPRTLDAQREAMVSTSVHWGLHAWAVYGIVGLSLAYFGFRYNLPLTIRSRLYPLLRNRIHGPIGHAADIFAICSTLFGIATWLGPGIRQINAGLACPFSRSRLGVRDRGSFFPYVRDPRRRHFPWRRNART